MQSPNGVNARLAPLAFHFRDGVPLKGEPPVETPNHRLVRLHVILEGVPVNGVDHGAHNGTGVLTNPEHKAWRITSRYKTLRARKKIEKQNQYLVLPPALICIRVKFVQKAKRSRFFGFRFYSFNSVNAPFQQRLNPARDTLTVTIEECQYITGSIGGTDQTRPDETLPFVGADEAHTLQITNVVSQFGLQVAYVS